VEQVESSANLRGGDLLFLISCTEIVAKEIRDLYRASLVIHASDLPRGRGWSPLVWQILEGKNDIVVSLIDAATAVDSGDIWHQEELHFEGHEVFDEICDALFKCHLRLMDFAVEGLGHVVPKPQPFQSSSYYRRRTPEDSRIDPSRTIAEQFNLLRVADPFRYPAFFEYMGQRYEIRINKVARSPDEGK